MIGASDKRALLNFRFRVLPECSDRVFQFVDLFRVRENGCLMIGDFFLCGERIRATSRVLPLQSNRVALLRESIDRVCGVGRASCLLPGTEIFLLALGALLKQSDVSLQRIDPPFCVSRRVPLGCFAP